MTPNFALFRKLFQACEALGPTYDYVPEADEKYPFIWLDAQTDTGRINNDVLGTASQTIRLYGLRKHRGQLDAWTAQLRDGCWTVRDAFGYRMSVSEFNVRVLSDYADSTPLLHYHIDVAFNYNKE